MSTGVKKLFDEAMRLDPEERAALTGLLIESLEPGGDEGVEGACLAEIERRKAELDSGEAETVPWEELRSRLYGGSHAPSGR